ncbi:MAG TPA: T9SS type A sorting domain-containing protein [Phaeodactylibacter sp.]|nr:T9SS type A sorting domain-containing protein [Phaeodactylibacter sp.]
MNYFDPLSKEFPQGIYFLSISNNSGISSIKIIKL